MFLGYGIGLRWRVCGRITTLVCHFLFNLGLYRPEDGVPIEHGIVYYVSSKEANSVLLDGSCGLYGKTTSNDPIFFSPVCQCVETSSSCWLLLLEIDWFRISVCSRHLSLEAELSFIMLSPLTLVDICYFKFLRSRHWLVVAPTKFITTK